MLNLVGILRLWYRIHKWELKWLRNQNSTWWLPPSWVSKKCFCLSFDRLSPTLVWMLRPRLRTHLWHNGSLYHPPAPMYETQRSSVHSIIHLLQCTKHNAQRFTLSSTCSNVRNTTLIGSLYHPPAPMYRTQRSTVHSIIHLLQNTKQRSSVHPIIHLLQCTKHNA